MFPVLCHMHVIPRRRFLVCLGVSLLGVWASPLGDVSLRPLSPGEGLSGSEVTTGNAQGGQGRDKTPVTLHLLTVGRGSLSPFLWLETPHLIVTWRLSWFWHKGCWPRGILMIFLLTTGIEWIRGAWTFRWAGFDPNDRKNNLYFWSWISSKVSAQTTLVFK